MSLAVQAVLVRILFNHVQDRIGTNTAKTARDIIMIVGFLRVLATGVLLLTTTTTLVQPARASLSSTELSQQCLTEVTSCSNDVTCASCSVVDEVSSATFAPACVDGLTVDGVESSTAVCFGLMAGICCLDDASGFACIANDNFVDLWLCKLNAEGCSVDEIACDEDGGPLQKRLNTLRRRRIDRTALVLDFWLPTLSGWLPC